MLQSDRNSSSVQDFSSFQPGFGSLLPQFLRQSAWGMLFQALEWSLSSVLWCRLLYAQFRIEGVCTMAVSIVSGTIVMTSELYV